MNREELKRLWFNLDRSNVKERKEIILEIDKKIKRFKNDEEKVTTLISKRKTLTNKLKTKK